MSKELIHRYLKSIAAAKGISQADIARQLSKTFQKPISRAVVNHVFRGHTHPEYLQKGICEILGISAKEVWRE